MAIFNSYVSLPKGSTTSRFTKHRRVFAHVLTSIPAREDVKGRVIGETGTSDAVTHVGMGIFAQNVGNSKKTSQMFQKWLV
jgi:hypothetical protein